MRCVSIIFSPFLLIPPPQVASSLSRGYTHLLQSSSLPPSLPPSLSLFCMHMHALTAKAYKQYLHVVLDLHNHTFVTSSTKYSMAIQFPTKISILFFGGGGAFNIIPFTWDDFRFSQCHSLPIILSLLSLQPLTCWLFLRSLIHTSSLDYLHIVWTRDRVT